MSEATSENTIASQNGSSLLDLGSNGGSKTDDDARPIVDNIFPEKPPQKQGDILLDFGGGAGAKDDALLGTNNTPSPSAAGLADLLGGFGASEAPAQPRVPQPTGQKPKSQTTSPLEPDLFAAFPGVGGASNKSSSSNDLFAADPFGSAAPTKPSPQQSQPDLFGSSSSGSGGQANLLGDLLAPSRPAAASQQQQQPEKSMSDQLVDDMMNSLSTKTSAAAQKQQQQQQPQRPNYNSAFFNANNNGNGGGSNGGSHARAQQQQPGKATFDDLLGGFTPTSSGNAGR